MKFGLPDSTIENIQKVFENNSKIDEVIVFGSRAKGNYKEGSDIDLAVKGRNIDFKDILRLSRQLDELNLPYKIDLLDYAAIKDKEVVEHIDRAGIVFYERWKMYKIEDIITLEYGKSLLDYRNDNGPYEVYGTNGKIGTTDKFLYDKPSLIIGRKGAYREVYLSKKPFFVIDTAFYTKNKLKDLDTLFLYYWFKNIDINEMDSGSAIPSTSREEVYDINIKLPPLSEQQTISSSLSSLDNKIDLLHRQNKTLEQLAETLFRQWFVEEAEDNWNEISLSEIAVHFKENINPSRTPDTIFKHYSLPAFDEGKEPKQELGKDILSGKYRVTSNSILGSKLNPRTPRVWGLFGDIDEENAICSTEFQVVKPKEYKWYNFIYCYLKSYHAAQELMGAASGTSGSHQRVNPQDIFNLTFKKPPNELIELFDNATRDSFQKIKLNTNQIHILVQVRDTLLPKLMSGEVRIEMN